MSSFVRHRRRPRTVIHVTIRSHSRSSLKTKNFQLDNYSQSIKSSNTQSLTNQTKTSGHPSTIISNTQQQRKTLSTNHNEELNSTQKMKMRTDVKDMTNDHHRYIKKKKRNKISKKHLFAWITAVLLFSIIIGILLLILFIKPTMQKKPALVALLRWNTTGITIAGKTNISGQTSDTLNCPWDLALDWSSTLYVTDRFNNRVQKFLKNALNGTTVAGRSDSMSGSNASSLYEPTGIAIDSNDNIYISYLGNRRIQYYANGALSGVTVAGITGVPGNFTYQMITPYGIDRDPISGTFYVADRYGENILRYQPNNPWGDIVAGGNGYEASTNQLGEPYGVHYDALSNSLFIAVSGSNNVVQWILGEKNWTLVAGSASGSPGSSPTNLINPSDVRLDPMGNIYVADRNNHRIQTFKSGQINGTTIAGITGMPGINATMLQQPISITFDGQLNLYVADQQNQRIQKFMRY